MQEIVLIILNNAIAICFALAHVLLSRWLLGLSTYEKDKRWLEQHSTLWNRLERLRWYRYPEYHYQLRFWRIVWS